VDEGKAVRSRPSAGARSAVGLVLLSLLVAGCAVAKGDKVGGGYAPLVVRVGSPDGEATPGTLALRRFASRVGERSGGRITVQVIYNASASGPDVEADIVRQVRAGTLDLGWVGTRAWDEQGISGFSALQAPFLVTNYGLLDMVMASDLPTRMLAELDRIGLIGLAAYPDQLRHPLGFESPMLTLDDFHAARIRVPKSRLSDEILRSLGAVPVHLDGAALADAIATRDLKGAETSVGNAVPFPARSYMTMNLTFYPKVQVLFGDSQRYSRLASEVRTTLDMAAAEALAFVRGQNLEKTDLDLFCAAGGSAVSASQSDVAEIVAATDPVTARLEADATVAGFMREIRDLSGASATGEPPTCPT
jgi:TRAP-type transport system periplasmic protein